MYYVPLAVNTDRMKRMSAAQEQNRSRFTEVYGGDIAFVGAMYNEKHNLYDKLDGISDFTRGYLDSVMNAQRKVYGHFFLEEVLNGEILKDMLNSLPLEPNNDGVETIQYLYADYFLQERWLMMTGQRLCQGLDGILEKNTWLICLHLMKHQCC